jgi:hypothetical protein
MNMLVIGKRLAVFSIKENKGGNIWVRAGSAFVNRDGSLNVLLDVLPLDGRLHVREAMEKKEVAAPAVAPAVSPYTTHSDLESQPVGGHS